MARLSKLQKKKDDMSSLLIKMGVSVLLLFVAFPLGVICCVIVGRALFREMTARGIIQMDVEGKNSVNWSKARQTGAQSARELRDYSRETARRAKSHMLESDIMDERMPRRRHSHTPVSYSYGKCSQERRLEQLKDLKGAGLLTELEYQQRRQKILSQR